MGQQNEKENADNQTPGMELMHDRVCMRGGGAHRLQPCAAFSTTWQTEPTQQAVRGRKWATSSFSNSTCHHPERGPRSRLGYAAPTKQTNRDPSLAASSKYACRQRALASLLEDPRADSSLSLSWNIKVAILAMAKLVFPKQLLFPQSTGHINHHYPFVCSWWRELDRSSACYCTYSTYRTGKQPYLSL